MLKRLLLLVLTVGLSANALAATSPKPLKIGIVVPIAHRAMDEIVKGFETGLKQAVKRPIVFDVKNAQSDPNLLRSIIQSFQNTHVDIIAPIGTDASQMTIAMVKHKPILAIAADISQTQREKKLPVQIAVVDDEISLATQMQLLQSLFPNLKKITLVHSAAEKIFPEVRQLKALAIVDGFVCQDLMVQQLADLYTISQRIDTDSQAIFVLKDNLIVSGIRTLVKEASKRKIPVITSDEGSVEAGAALAIGVHESQIGLNAAELAAQIIQGKLAGQLPIKRMDNLHVFVNQSALLQQGLEFAKVQAVAKKMQYQVEMVNGVGG